MRPLVEIESFSGENMRNRKMGDMARGKMTREGRRKENYQVANVVQCDVNSAQLRA